MRIDNNNEFCVKIRVPDTANELQWMYNPNCFAFIVDIISDILVSRDDEKFSVKAVETYFDEIKNSGLKGYSLNEKRRAYYIDAQDFRRRNSRFNISNEKKPAIIQIFAIDKDMNLIDCGADSRTVLGKIVLNYSAKSPILNKNKYTVKFDCSSGYVDGMAVYVVQIENKTYEIPITKDMLKKELQIIMPKKQEFSVRATNEYKKVLKINFKEGGID